MKFLLSINYMVWLVISAIFFAIGEFLSKKFALNPRMILVVYLVVADCLSILTWLPAILQKNSLSIVGTIWSVMSLLLTVSIGVLIFGERLSTIGTIGIIVSIISIILLSLA